MSRKILISSVCGALLAGALSTQAAISVGPTGSAVETFSATPPATEWSSLGFAGGAGDYTTAVDLEAAVQGVSAPEISNTVGASGTIPPSSNALARRNTSQNFMQIRPTGVGFTALMATLQNDTGAAALFLTVNYDFNWTLPAGSSPGEEIPGWLAFYSLTGEAGSWQLVPGLSGGDPGVKSARVSLGSWAAGAPLYLLWVDDNASTSTTAPNEEGGYWMDNFSAVASNVRNPAFLSLTGNPIGFSAEIENGGAPLTLNTGSIQASLNGTNVTHTLSTAGNIFTINYAGGPLPVGSTNTVVISFADNGTPAGTQTVERTFVVSDYNIVPPSYAVTGVNTALPGFKARVVQSEGPRNPGDVNSIENAERHLAGVVTDPNTGQPYANIADLSLADANGIFNIETVINWNQDSPASVGSFNDLGDPPYFDDIIPGIPGQTFSFDHIAAEILTYLDLKAGVYTMGVNSDDGFKVTTGPNPRDFNSLVLGSFGTGRGVSDSLFTFVILQDGVYPFRLAWWEGTGGAALEWFTVNAAGQKVLINDRAQATAVRAYREGPLGPTFIKLIAPYPGLTNVSGDAAISITLGDAAAQVVPSSVQLYFNNALVQPTVSKPAGSSDTVITYDPPGILAPDSQHIVRLVYGNNATPSVLTTNEFTFTIKSVVLIPIASETVMWKYHNEGADLGTAWREPGYNDSAWPEGPALLSNDSAAPEPIRTPLVRQSPEGNNIITDYFRHKFTFNGNPAATQLILRHVVDDGVVIYLNGVEVHRFGTAATTVFDFMTTFSDHETAYSGPFLIPSGSLIRGENVIAAEVHQTSATSSDATFGIELLAGVRTDIPPTSFVSMSPATNAVNVATNAEIRFVVADGSREIVPSSIRLVVNGQPVTPVITKEPGSIASTVTYTPAAGWTPDAQITGEFSYMDTAGATTTHSISFHVAPTFVVLVGVNDTQMWKYSNEGLDLGTAWREKNYNDSAWLEGAALLAAETGGTSGETIRTEIQRFDPNGLNIVTDYFRTRFNFTGDPATARLRLRHIVDDGAVFYLNGVEIHRFGFAADAVITATTFAAGHENAWEGPFDIPMGLVVQGENVLAAELHQPDLTSSDAVFGAEIQLITSAPQAVQPRFTSVTQSGGNIVVQWTGTGTLESATSLSPANWAPVQGAANPHTEPTDGRMKFFRVRQ